MFWQLSATITAIVNNCYDNCQQLLRQLSTTVMTIVSNCYDNCQQLLRQLSQNVRNYCLMSEDVGSYAMGCVSFTASS